MYNKFLELLKTQSNEKEFEEYFDMIKLHSKPVKEFNTESHHIFPTSIYGKNNNNFTVHVPMKIHFKLHEILWKMFENKDVRKYKRMANAVHKMGQGREGFTPEEYEIARLAIIAARKGTSTVYDKILNKNIKIESSLVDNIRYFVCNPRTIISTGKNTWMSTEDPRYIDTITKAPEQKYFDKETNSYVSLLPIYAIQFPDRYVHSQKGKKYKRKEEAKGLNLYYNKETNEYVKIKTTLAKELGFEGCSLYIDKITNKTIFMAPSVAKSNPDRYVSNNKGGANYYFRDTLKPTGMKKDKYDPKIHMKRGEYNKLIRELHEPITQSQ